MKKHLVDLDSTLFVRRRKIRARLMEHFLFPSKLAQDIWNYLLVIGTSRCAPGHRYRKEKDQRGYLLHYVHDGEMHHLVNGRSFRVGRGEACLLAMNRPWEVRNEGSRQAQLWEIVMDGRHMARIVAELNADRDPLFTNFNGVRFEAFFHRLWALAIQKPQACEAEIHAVLSALLADLFALRSRRASLAGAVADKHNGLSEKVSEVMDFITRFYPDNIGLKHIEAAVGLNMFHLSRKFRREVGVAPIQYLNRFRVEQARGLLESSDKPVGEIAAMVGIPDQNYFARIFRRLIGYSPRDFRKKKK